MELPVNVSETLTTKKAVELLLDGTLRLKVCRYCLKIRGNLSEMDEILVIGIEGSLHEVTIHDMMASFYPFKVAANACFPNKICKDCLNSVMKGYLFAQQCERAERAMRNCFEDIQEKYNKLDPIQPVKKRGKRKLNPNTNIIYVENDKVIDYAKPVINIVNTNSVYVHGIDVNMLECPKCWQIQPTPEALVVHEESHPKNMWYNCKLCGKSFVKRFHLKQHIKRTHNTDETEEIPSTTFYCTECGENNENMGKHYQHIEKHKFKSMLQNIVHGKTERLCVLCLEEGTKMTYLNERIDLHGGYPKLNGEFTIKNILWSVFASQKQIKNHILCKEVINKDNKIAVKRFNYDESKIISITLHEMKEKGDKETPCKICWIFNKPCACLNKHNKIRPCSYCWLFKCVNKCQYCS